jgi:hypothetical protein
MSHSNDQFNKLLAQIITRANKMLKTSNVLLPFGILLDEKDFAEVLLTVDDKKPYSSLLDSLQESMQNKVREKNYTAACIVYADYNKGLLIALLENKENFCLKVVIPVKADKELSLLAEQMRAEEGGIYIFSIKSTS